MNFVAHVEVAHRASDTATSPPGTDLPPLLVGAALPDFASIGRFRLEPGAATGQLAEGIRLHHRTDDVFHGDERFRHLMARLRGELTASGMSRGAARACGHVGVELLLDGHLLADDDTVRRSEALLRSIGEPSEEVLDAVIGTRRDAWRAHLLLVADRITPGSYGDTGLVAARLHRMLSYRPRLAFPHGQVSLLSRALRLIQPAVGEVAEALVADTAQAIE